MHQSCSKQMFLSYIKEPVHGIACATLLPDTKGCKALAKFKSWPKLSNKI